MTLDFALPPGGALIGIGIDIVEIARIKDLRERQGERFLDRVYTETELQYCMRMKAPDQHLAARFAAKEAVTKAFTVGIGEYFDWKSVGVVAGDRRQPEVELDEGTAYGSDRWRSHSVELVPFGINSHAVAAIVGQPQLEAEQ